MRTPEESDHIITLNFIASSPRGTFCRRSIRSSEAEVEARRSGKSSDGARAAEAANGAEVSIEEAGYK